MHGENIKIHTVMFDLRFLKGNKILKYIKKNPGIVSG